MFFLSPKKDINKGLEEYHDTKGAVLVDIRTKDECAYGVIPGSINLPLHKLKRVRTLIPDPETPVFCYCQNGGRADRAVKRLKRMGYINAKSIGGLTGYDGELKR